MHFYQVYTYYTLSETLLVIGTSTPVHSCGNSEVMHSSCVWDLLHLFTVIGKVRYCIRHEHIILSSILSDA